jgi:hypothetical protein
MKIKLVIYLLLILVIKTVPFNLNAEIKSPNYDFTFTSIEPFFPGKLLSELAKDKTIKSDIFEDSGTSKIIRTKVHRGNYILDIYNQVKGDQITDVFIRLPQHFLHDLFLADLVKRYKKQDKFVRKDKSALYVWMNRDGNNIIYHGSCSITCFPMFIEIVSTEKTVVPLYQKFNAALPIK